MTDEERRMNYGGYNASWFADYIRTTPESVEGFAKRYDLSGDVLGAPHEGKSQPTMLTQDAIAAEIARRRGK